MESSRKIQKIIFFQTPSEVEEYISNKEKLPLSRDKTLLIAMTPSARSSLKEKGIKLDDTLPYFTTESHINLLKKSKVLIDWLRENSDFAGVDIDAKETIKDSFIFWIRCSIHYCLWIIEIILNAVEMHRPDIISASCSGRKAVSSLYIEPEEKYLGYLVKAVAQAKNLKYEDISENRRVRSDPSLLRSRRYITSFVKFALRYVRFQLWARMVFLKSIFAKGKAIFFTTARNMDMVVNEFRNKRIKRPYYFLKGPLIPPFDISNFIIEIFWRPYAGSVKGIRGASKDLEERIIGKGEFFSYRDISFAEVISQKIKSDMANYALGLSLWSKKLNRFIIGSKAAAFVSDGNRFDDRVIAELCRRNGIPAVLISHGSHTPPKNEFENIEWGEHARGLLRAPFSIFALQSPLAEGYLKSFPLVGTCVKTGPIAWGRPVNSEKSRILFRKMFNGTLDFEKTRIVLHAGSPKPGYALRFYVYETIDEYVEAILELAEAIQKIPHAVLIVKFRSRPWFTIDDLRNLIPFSEKVILSVNEGFGDLLGMSDLLVSFSSTTIEEALHNRIPALLYGGRGRYQHISAPEIKKGDPLKPSAIYHIKESGDLEYGVRSILDLNIDRVKDGHLFEPYVYGQADKSSLAELLIHEDHIRSLQIS